MKRLIAIQTLVLSLTVIFGLQAKADIYVGGSNPLITEYKKFNLTHYSHTTSKRVNAELQTLCDNGTYAQCLREMTIKAYRITNEVCQSMNGTPGLRSGRVHDYNYQIIHGSSKRLVSIDVSKACSNLHWSTMPGMYESNHFSSVRYRLNDGPGKKAAAKSYSTIVRRWYVTESQAEDELEAKAMQNNRDMCVRLGYVGRIVHYLRADDINTQSRTTSGKTEAVCYK